MQLGDFLLKPGWVRISIHPTTTNDEASYICDSLIALSENYEQWKEEYRFHEGVFTHVSEEKEPTSVLQNSWFEL